MSDIGHITGQEVTQQVDWGPDGPLDYPMTHTVKSDSVCSVEIASRQHGPPGITVKVYAPHETTSGDRAVKEYERLTAYFAQKGERA